jgi:hypothetical protein
MFALIIRRCEAAFVPTARTPMCRIRNFLGSLLNCIIGPRCLFRKQILSLIVDYVRISLLYELDMLFPVENCMCGTRQNFT